MPSEMIYFKECWWYFIEFYFDEMIQFTFTIWKFIILFKHEFFISFFALNVKQQQNNESNGFENHNKKNNEKDW